MVKTDIRTLKDIEKEYFYLDRSKTDVLTLLISFPYSIKYIHAVEFLEGGEELPHHNETTEDLTLVIGLNKWKNKFQLYLRNGAVEYPFQFAKGASVLFDASVPRRVINQEGIGDRMLVISLKKDNSRKQEFNDRLTGLRTKRRLYEQENNIFTKKQKFSRFWRGLKNGINIFR